MEKLDELKNPSGACRSGRGIMNASPSNKIRYAGITYWCVFAYNDTRDFWGRLQSWLRHKHVGTLVVAACSLT